MKNSLYSILFSRKKRKGPKDNILCLDYHGVFGHFPTIPDCSKISEDGRRLTKKSKDTEDFQEKNPNISTSFLSLYYHLRLTVKRERFLARVYFSNETVSQTTVSTGAMKMFRLEHETMNVCQKIVARFGHVECMFDKVNDIFQGFGSLVSLRL